MTTYATPAAQQVPPSAGPSTLRLTTADPAPQGPRRGRAGPIVAAGAFAVAAMAAVAAAFTLATPARPAVHTVKVAAPASPNYTSSDIEAAKATTCTEWDQSARSMASAGKLRAAIAAPDGSSPEARRARNDEKRVVVTSIEFLRAKINLATPAAVAVPVENWITAQIDSLHEVNMRDWDASNDAADRANGLVSQIVTECGLR